MSGHIFVSYATADEARGNQIVAVLRALLGASRVAARSGLARLPGYVATDGDAARATELTGSDLVVALVSEQSLASGEVAFELGAAWALRKRCLLLSADPIQPDQISPWLKGPVATRELTETALLDVARSFPQGASSVDSAALSQNPAAQTALDALFPTRRENAEDDGAFAAYPPEPLPMRPMSLGAAPRISTPPPQPADSCKNSLLAGRSIADSVFASRRGDPLPRPTSLDLAFGPLLRMLDFEWDEMRDQGDPERWHALASDKLEQLPVERRATHHWYRMGFELGSLINLASDELRDGGDTTLTFQAHWQAALDGLCEAGLREHVDAAGLAEVVRWLENLRANPEQRDYANLSRAQNKLRHLAAERDATIAAPLRGTT